MTGRRHAEKRKHVVRRRELLWDHRESINLQFAGTSDHADERVER
jgi:hypothetical protein